MAEVEVVESRDWNHGVGVTQASVACDSTLALATEKDAERSRLGELHRLLNCRKGSLSATYEKNADANNSAYDMNPKNNTSPGHLGGGVRSLRSLHEKR